jgi:drug/metabolite transporter (DMT)-like permease
MLRGAAAGGVGLATLTALTWGGQFVVGKSALDRVDAFPLTTVRYAVAATLLVAVLVAVEGRKALRLQGHGRELLWLGTLGFAGFNLFAYTGLAHSRPQSAALIVALGPLLTALVLWRRTGIRPAASTFLLLGIALAGVFLVLSKGHPGTVVSGSGGWGDGLVLVGTFSFVLYGIGAADHRDLSPLRYTTLTAVLGWPAIAAATGVAVGAGLVPVPSGHDLWAVTPQLAYITLPGAVVAVLAWNAAIDLIGVQNVALFGNLIPVTTFVIQIVRGYRPGWVEAGGAVLTIAALVFNSLRMRAAPQSARLPAVEIEAAVEAA